ncbi:hypothetical protein Goari_008094, partial [Gossypium aridum]|nr:hypothetical protein [Gossypium aridum]
SSKKSEKNQSDDNSKADDSKTKDNPPPSTPSTPPSTPSTPPSPPKPSSPPSPKPPAPAAPAPAPKALFPPAPKPLAAAAPAPVPKASFPPAPVPAPLPAPKSAPALSPSFGEGASELIKSVCEISTFKDYCANTIGKTIEENPQSATQPKELVKSFITKTTDELDKAFTKASTFELKTDVERKAFDVCKEVMANAKEELQSSVDRVGTIEPGKLPSNGDLNTWLSAVMSYQETCIDSFPDGPLKNDFRTTLNSSQVYTSNSLAMVRQLSSLMTLGKEKPPAKRRLLQTKFRLLAKGGYPSWFNHEERRLLKEADDDKKPIPNVTVAQDGSGNFRTINEALAAVPQKYEGR